VDTGVQPTLSPPLATVCALLVLLEHQQGVIAQQQSRLEQRQLHLDELRATNEHQLQTLQEQQTQIDALKAEVARVKQLPKKPKIRPSTLPKDDPPADQQDREDTSQSEQGETEQGKRNSAKARNRHKDLPIHHTQSLSLRICPPDHACSVMRTTPCRIC
jgi:TolA-binding protein